MIDCSQPDDGTIAWAMQCTSNASANSLAPSYGLLLSFAGIFAVIGLVILDIKVRAANQWVIRILNLVQQSLGLAFYGLVGMIPIILGIAFWRLGEAASDWPWLKISGVLAGIIASYAVLAGYGYLVRRLVKWVGQGPKEPQKASERMAR